jgi:hypothetical protein
MVDKTYDDDMTLMVLKWHGIGTASGASHTERNGAHRHSQANILT